MSHSVPLRAVFFDLDGTLTDPFDGITLSIEHALTALGHPCDTRESLRACIGPPLRRTFAELLATTDATVIERAVALYRERYFAVGLFENRAYDGVDEMLRTLAASGLRLFVVTSKVVDAATRIVEHFDLAGYFDGIYGSDLQGRLDDKADLLAHVLESERLDASECVMIGDRMHDVHGAARNAIAAIGVTWGFGSVAELTDAGATWLCGSPGEVLDIVASRVRPDGASTSRDADAY
jgi:phosphoglycolate phosphatase